MSSINPLQHLKDQMPEHKQPKIVNDKKPRRRKFSEKEQTKTPREICVSFSFQSWKQEEFFGLGDEKTNWFVSLMNRLAEVSDMTPDELFTDHAKGKFLRFHKINWNQRNCPMTEEAFLKLLPEHFKEDKELSVYQFQISKATGRVIGFFDAKTVFHIVLLDPKHNMQPSRDFNYKVDPTFPLDCEYKIILNLLNHVKKEIESEKSPEEKMKEIYNIVNASDFDKESKSILVHSAFFEDISSLIQQQVTFTSMDDILLEALDLLLERNGIK